MLSRPRVNSTSSTGRACSSPTRAGLASPSGSTPSVVLSGTTSFIAHSSQRLVEYGSVLTATPGSGSDADRLLHAYVGDLTDRPQGDQGDQEGSGNHGRGDPEGGVVSTGQRVQRAVTGRAQSRSSPGGDGAQHGKADRPADLPGRVDQSGGEARVTGRHTRHGQH